MRGKLAKGLVDAVIARNIPAYAGKTVVVCCRYCHPGEHPRVCGENLVWRCALPSPRGTSPRMRGKPPSRQTQLGLPRNIPAYAGKTGCRRNFMRLLPEHPRVCGENNLGIRPLVFISGTSPRMRGKLVSVLISSWEPGNIPAYAGKTTACCGPSTTCWEHPRVCGENHGSIAALEAATGTSPRMRGKPALQRVGKICMRNIPAYAGKTLSS